MKTLTFIFLIGILSTTNQKPCGKNEVQVGLDCVCIPGFYRTTQGKCTDCPLDSVVSTDQTTCICFNGYFDEGKKKCVTKCGVNEQIINGKCTCIGYLPVTGICTLCPIYSTPSADLTTCVCDNGLLFNQAYNLCYKLCTTTMNGICICPIGTYFFGPGYCAVM